MMGFKEFKQFVKGLIRNIIMVFGEFKQFVKGLIGNI